MNTSTNTTAPTAPDWGELLDLTVLSPREQAFDTFIERTIIGQPRGKKAAKRAFRRIQSKPVSYTHLTLPTKRIV